ncbi:MAG: hypothetical protein QOI54_2518 [Actinomycetota bacterium]|jgi:hypothetical protein|nr:hypothetical protein [Actinomycetota bacterium]
MVISVHMLGAAADPAGYYLDRAGCPSELSRDPTGYYIDGPAMPPAGRWVGSGAAAAGLVGPIDQAGAQVLRGLLAGRSPNGSHMAAPVLRAAPRGRRPAGPLVAAVRAMAAERGIPAADLFVEPKDRTLFELWARRSDAPRGAGRESTVAPARAGQLAARPGWTHTPCSAPSTRTAPSPTGTPTR